MAKISHNHTLILFALLLQFSSCSGQSQKQPKVSPKNQYEMSNNEMPKTEEEWKKRLSPEQYYVLREKGTERAFTGKFNLTKENGVYTCAGCGNELFSSDMKFDSHCGWPSFDKEIQGGKVKTQVDKTYGMVRTEIMCAKCGGHLGHLFDDGPTETGLRYCVNSLSLEFVPVEK
jgi:methionine-R-sulfoxide reductase